MSTEEITNAVSEALERERRTREEMEKEVTGSDVVGAGCLGLIPILGFGVGIYQLIKGRTNKGLLYMGVSFALWIFFFVILSM